MVSANKNDGGNISAVVAYTKLQRNRVIANLKSNIPPEVRGLRHFLVFRFSPPRKKGGKVNKIPYYVNGSVRHGKHGSAEDLQHLCTFDEAIHAYETHEDIAGIGVAALPTSGLTYVDLDKCVNVGEDMKGGALNALAKELVSWGTYAEYSPSGTGLRMVFSGNIKANHKNNTAGIELFCTKGFVTLTGIPFGQIRPVAALTTGRQGRLAELVGVAHAADESEDAEDELRNIPIPLDDARYRTMKRALQHIDPDCGYSDWIMVGQALHSSDPVGQRGWRLWLKWSARGKKFADTNEEEMRAKWEGFGAGRGVTLASIVHLAKQGGFHPRGWDKEILTTARAHAQGVSGVNLTTLALRPEQKKEITLDPVAPGLFDHVGVYPFIGRAKVGKSRVLGMMAAAALTGGQVFGHKFDKPCKVLCLSAEEDGASIMERIRTNGVEPTEYSDSLAIIDRHDVVEQAELNSESVDYVTWLAAILDAVKPRFCYLDTLIGLRMVWRREPEGRAFSATERDYQVFQEIEELADLHGCVIVASVHASKRKSISTAVGFDPFEQIGTTSWALAAGCGAMVLGDRLGSNPFEEEDDGQRCFSVRGRYRRAGDAHYVLQTQENGLFQLLGTYANVARTTNEALLLEALRALGATADQPVHATALAAEWGVSRKTVLNTVKGMIDRVLLDGTAVRRARGPGGGYWLAGA